MNHKVVTTSVGPTGRRAASLFVALAALLVLVAPACSNSSAGANAAQTCSLNSDCTTGLVCAFGKCSVQCRTDADCTTGDTCVNTGAVAACQSDSVPCNDQSNCPAPLACASDYRCRNLCTTPADCNVLGIMDEVCAKDANGVDYCADPADVTNGTITEAPPPGASGTVVEPVIDATTGTAQGGDATSDGSSSGSSSGSGGSSSGGSSSGSSGGGSSSGSGEGGSDSGATDVSDAAAAPICSPACAGSTVCVAGGSGPSCQACGAQGGPCCAAQTCNTNFTCLASGVCECGSANQSCCEGTSCNSGLTCELNDAGPSLCACGILGTRCCPGTDGGTPSCSGGLACSGSNCTCLAEAEYATSDYSSTYAGAIVRRVDGTIWTCDANDGTFAEIAGPSGPFVATSIAVSGYNGTEVAIGCGIVSGGVWCFPLAYTLTDSTDLGAGLGPADDTTSPQQVLQSAGGGTPLTNIVQISGGTTNGSDFCAVSSAGGAWCWGYGGKGQLGNGGTSNASVATPVMLNVNDSVTNLVEVRLGSEAACGRETDGSVWCWGTNDYGELGVPTGTLAESYYPVQVPFTGTSAQTTATRLVAGPYQTFCAIMSDTSVVCWGANASSQAGAPVADAGSSVGPTQVVIAAGSGALTGIIDLAADSAGAICAKNGNLAIVCWGSGSGFGGAYPAAYQNSAATAAVDIVGALSGGFAGLTYVDPSGLLIAGNATFGAQPPCTNLLP